MRILCNVAGITFRNKSDEFLTMEPEGIVTFEHEPTNKFDPNAIKVLYNGIWLGYVKADSYAQEFLKEHPEVLEAQIIGYGYATGTGQGLKFNNMNEGRLSAVGFCIVHGESNVTYDEDNNYIINGKPYKRLSGVMKYFNPEPDSPGLDKWKIDEHENYNAYRQNLSKLARAGTAMHSAIENFLRYGQEDMLIPEGFHNFMKKHDVQWEKEGIEQLLLDEDQGIAGTADLKATAHDGKKKPGPRMQVTIDWKSSKAPTIIHKIKTAWYAYKQGSDEAWVVAFGGNSKQGYSLARVSTDKIEQFYTLIGAIRAAIGVLNG